VGQWRLVFAGHQINRQRLGPDSLLIGGRLDEPRPSVRLHHLKEPFVSRCPARLAVELDRYVERRASA